MTDIAFAILGGGPTGLGAALRLLEAGERDFLLVEREDAFGGLSSSKEHSGFTWDLGCHVLYSQFPLFDQALGDALGDDGWIRHERNSAVWIDGLFVPYPIQNNIHRLDREDCERCLAGFRDASMERTAYNSPPGNFSEWAVRTFGTALHQLFFAPYNAKQWAFPLDRLDWRWIDQRVSVPDAERLERNVSRSRDDVTFGPNRCFRYPKSGGMGSVWRSLEERVPASMKRTGTAVTRVDLGHHRLTLADGGTLTYRHLINTAPLDLFVRMTGEPELMNASRGLAYTSTHLLGLGFEGRVPGHFEGVNWIYYPDGRVPFHRATLSSSFSPANVPDADRNWSLLLEATESPRSPLNADRLAEDLIQGAADVGLIRGKGGIRATWHHRLTRSYPIPSLDRDPCLARLLPALEDRDVYSRGRFGAWKYEVSNQDHAYMQGVEVIDRLLGRVEPGSNPEPTLNRSGAPP